VSKKKIGTTHYLPSGKLEYQVRLNSGVRMAFIQRENGLKMEQEYYSKSDGEERAYDKKLQYLLCRKYPEGATKHS